MKTSRMPRPLSVPGRYGPRLFERQGQSGQDSAVDALAALLLDQLQRNSGDDRAADELMRFYEQTNDTEERRNVAGLVFNRVIEAQAALDGTNEKRWTAALQRVQEWPPFG